MRKKRRLPGIVVLGRKQPRKCESHTTMGSLFSVLVNDEVTFYTKYGYILFLETL